MAESIDLKARQVIMTAWLYYEKSISLISDTEFDALCKEVAGELEWLEAMGECEIDPVRCVQLGSAGELKASGFHIKVTQMSIAGACSWYQSLNKRHKPLDPGPFVGRIVEVPSTSGGVLMRGLNA